MYFAPPTAPIHFIMLLSWSKLSGSSTKPLYCSHTRLDVNWPLALSLWTILFPLTTLYPFLDIPWKKQSLCIGCSLCMECSSFREPWGWLLHFILVFARVTTKYQISPPLFIALTISCHLLNSFLKCVPCPLSLTRLQAPWEYRYCVYSLL